MKTVGPLLYVSVVAAIIGIPAYALSSAPLEKSAAAAKNEKVGPQNFKRHATNENVIADSNRRPVWIMPTREYNNSAAQPQVSDNRAAAKEVVARKENRTKKVAQKPQAERQASAPQRQVTMSYAQKHAQPKPQFGFMAGQIN